MVSIKLKERFVKDIPSAQEFISKIRTKHSGFSENSSQISSNELDIMKEWISEHQRKSTVKPDDEISVEINCDPGEDSFVTNTNFNKYFHMGIASFEAGLYKECVPFFGKALRINPQHKDAMRYLLKAFYYAKINNQANQN